MKQLPFIDKVWSPDSGPNTTPVRGKFFQSYNMYLSITYAYTSDCNFSLVLFLYRTCPWDGLTGLW